MATHTDKYAAGEQGLGYVYQIRFALAHLMKQDESLALLIEAVRDAFALHEGARPGFQLIVPSTRTSLRTGSRTRWLRTLG